MLKFWVYSRFVVISIERGVGGAGKPGILLEHRGDWKYQKEFFGFSAFWNWKVKYMCHVCRAENRGQNAWSRDLCGTFTRRTDSEILRK